MEPGLVPGGYEAGLEFSWVWAHAWFWLSLQLAHLEGQGMRMLDIGSQRSPWPWFAALNGFDVIVSDVTWEFRALWRRASRDLDSRTQDTLSSLT